MLGRNGQRPGAEPLESRQMLHGGGWEGRHSSLDSVLFGSATIEEQVGRVFERYDANDDGVLNADDNLPGRVTRRFGDADANSDGGISTAELTTFLGSQAVSRILGLSDNHSRGHLLSDAQISDRVARAIDLVDADGGGDTDQSEVTDAVWQQLSTADANSDSSLSSDELKSLLQQMREERIGAMVTKYVDQLMERFDTDNGSDLDQSELSAARWNKIKAADVNGDSSISEQELTTYITAQITQRLSGNSTEGSTTSGNTISRIAGARSLLRIR